MTMRILGLIVLSVALVSTASPKAQSPKPRAQSEWPPRTPDGQPDIQGVWGNPDSGGFTHSLEPRPYLAKLGEPPLTFTTTSRAGRGVRPTVTRTTYIVDPPEGVLPYQPWAFERRNSVMRHSTRPELWQFDPETLGWPGGLPRMHVYSSLDGETGGPWQVMQGPGFVLFLYETQHEFRYVPLSNNARPGRDIRLWMGASRGRWEGNTLVIESTNHNDSTRFDIVGDFHSDEMRVTERFTYVDKDTLEYRATVDDPKVFTRPWTIAFPNKRTRAGTELLEYAGVEGDISISTATWLQ